MRKKIVAGNWKMNVSRIEAQVLLQAIKEGVLAYPDVSVAIFPGYAHLQLTESLLVDSLIEWAGKICISANQAHLRVKYPRIC